MFRLFFYLWSSILSGSTFSGTSIVKIRHRFYAVYRSNEVSVEGIHRNLLSSVRRCKYDVVNFTIEATHLCFTSKFDFQFYSNSSRFAAILDFSDRPNFFSAENPLFPFQPLSEKSVFVSVAPDIFRSGADNFRSRAANTKNAVACFSISPPFKPISASKANWPFLTLQTIRTNLPVKVIGLNFVEKNCIFDFFAYSPIHALISAHKCFASHSHRWCG